MRRLTPPEDLAVTFAPLDLVELSEEIAEEIAAEQEQPKPDAEAASEAAAEEAVHGRGEGDGRGEGEEEGNTFSKLFGAVVAAGSRAMDSVALAAFDAELRTVLLEAYRKR